MALLLFSDSARAILRLSSNEAVALRHDWIGTEHILLAWLHWFWDEGTPEKVLARFNTTVGEVSELVKSHIKPVTEKTDPMDQDLQYTARAKRALRYSMEEAHLLGREKIEPETLFLGLVMEGKGIAAQVLMQRGIYWENAREEVKKLFSESAQ